VFRGRGADVMNGGSRAVDRRHRQSCCLAQGRGLGLVLGRKVGVGDGESKGLPVSELLDAAM